MEYARNLPIFTGRSKLLPDLSSVRGRDKHSCLSLWVQSRHFLGPTGPKGMFQRSPADFRQMSVPTLEGAWIGRERLGTGLGQAFLPCRGQSVVGTSIPACPFQ